MRAIRLMGLIALIASGRGPSAHAQAEPGLLAMRKASADRAMAAIGPGGDLDARVGRLIDRLALGDGAQVQSAVDALVVLGRPAVPAMIRRLDDRRPMKVSGLMYVNDFPGAFEGIRHYPALKVVDALTQVLNDITGSDLPMILPDTIRSSHRWRTPQVDRALDPQRDRAVAAWRASLDGRPAGPRPPSKSPSLDPDSAVAAGATSNDRAPGRFGEHGGPRIPIMGVVPWQSDNLGGSPKGLRTGGAEQTQMGAIRPSRRTNPISGDDPRAERTHSGAAAGTLGAPNEAKMQEMCILDRRCSAGRTPGRPTPLPRRSQSPALPPSLRAERTQSGPTTGPLDAPNKAKIQLMCGPEWLRSPGGTGSRERDDETNPIGRLGASRRTNPIPRGRPGPGHPTSRIPRMFDVDPFFDWLVLASTLVDLAVALAAILVRRPVEWTTGPRVTFLRMLGAVALTSVVFAVKAVFLVGLGVHPFGILRLIYVDLVIVIPLVGMVLIWADRGWDWPYGPFMPWSVRNLALASLLLPAFGYYATCVEPFRLRVERVGVPVAAGREFQRPLRIGVLSDIQIRHVTSYEHRVIDTLMAERPRPDPHAGRRLPGSDADFGAASAAGRAPGSCSPASTRPRASSSCRGTPTSPGGSRRSSRGRISGRWRTRRPSTRAAACSSAGSSSTTRAPRPSVW